MTAKFLFAKARLRTRPAPAYSLALATGLLLASAGAQAADASCITAGRLDADGRWAPQFQTVRLLDDAGRALPTRTRADLARVRGVEITQPALLSTCEGERALTRGGDTTTAKAPVPAAKPGRLAVDGVGFPKLQSGGELVELKVQVPPDRVVMVTR